MKSRYDLLVIGGGAGGAAAATTLAAAGRSVLLVERGADPIEARLPARILQESARRLRALREAAGFGLRLPAGVPEIDWPAIQQRKRAILRRRAGEARQRIGRLPSLEAVSGTAALLGSGRARVTPRDGASAEVRFGDAVIATGSVPARPEIHGVDLPRVLDSMALLALDQPPSRLVVIGGGAVGVELGQLFRTFGSEVTLLETAPRILCKADGELAGRLQERLEAEGIAIHVGCRIDRICHTGHGLFVEGRTAAGGWLHPLGEYVLLATGRRPDLTGLGLENTGIRHGPRGIEVDAGLGTGETNVYALGIAAGEPASAPWVAAQGRALARRLLGFPGPLPDPDADSAVIFSESELGMAGLTRVRAEAAALEVETARCDFADNARAQIAGRDDGLLKIVFERGSRRIVGVQAVAEGAGELMGEAALAIAARMPVDALAGAIHPHPTLGESFGQTVRDWASSLPPGRNR